MTSPVSWRLFAWHRNGDRIDLGFAGIADEFEWNGWIMPRVSYTVVAELVDYQERCRWRLVHELRAEDPHGDLVDVLAECDEAYDRLELRERVLWVYRSGEAAPCYVVRPDKRGLYAVGLDWCWVRVWAAECDAVALPTREEWRAVYTPQLRSVGAGSGH